LHFSTRPGQRADLVAAFRHAKVFEVVRRIEGFRSAQLLVPNDPAADQVIVTACWDDEASYDRWLAHPDRETINTGLLPFLSGPPEGAMYSIADAASSA
jgi:heme-degrading monooxygenase HmoA